MEQYLAKSESNQVEVTELEYYSLEPEDADICIELFAEGARDNVVITNSYCSTLEEEGEALRLLMRYGKSMEQIISGNCIRYGGAPST